MLKIFKKSLQNFLRIFSTRKQRGYISKMLKIFLNISPEFSQNFLNQETERQDMGADAPPKTRKTRHWQIPSNRKLLRLSKYYFKAGFQLKLYISR
jgi:hypothetical protein